MSNAARTQITVTTTVTHSSQFEMSSFLSGISSGLTKQKASTVSSAVSVPACPPIATTVPPIAAAARLAPTPAARSGRTCHDSVAISNSSTRDSSQLGGGPLAHVHGIGI